MLPPWVLPRQLHRSLTFAACSSRQIDTFHSAEHELSLKQFSLLKSAVRAWRFKEPKNFVVTYVEFRRGVKMLTDYIPPLIISRNQYSTQVIPFCNHRGLLGGMGFRGLMKTALRRYQLRELYRAQMQGDWCSKAVRAVMIGTAGLLREDMESQRAGRSANRLKTRLSSKCDSGKTQDPLNQTVWCCLSQCLQLSLWSCPCTWFKWMADLNGKRAAHARTRTNTRAYARSLCLSLTHTHTYTHVCVYTRRCLLLRCC